MLHLPRTVSKRITLAVTTADARAEVAGEFRYDPADPFAVSLVVCPDLDQPVEWVFARDLLTDGMSEPHGVGDVTVEPAADVEGHFVRITLATDTVASMLASAAEVAEFLVETYTVVPSGTETDRIDIDAAIEALLA